MLRLLTTAQIPGTEKASVDICVIVTFAMFLCNRAVTKKNREKQVKKCSVTLFLLFFTFFRILLSSSLQSLTSFRLLVTDFHNRFF